MVIQKGDTKMAARTNMHKHPKTGVYYFRKSIPKHLRPFIPSPYTNKHEVLISLHTKDVRDATRLHAEANVRVERFLDAAKAAHGKASPQTEIITAPTTSGYIKIDMSALDVVMPVHDDFQIIMDYGTHAEPIQEPPTISQPANTDTIESVFDKYARENDLREESAWKFKKSWEVFCSLSNLTLKSPITAPTKHMLRDFKHAMMDYPAVTTKAMRSMSASDLIAHAKEKGLTPIASNSLKRHMAALSALLKYACRNDYRPDDPTSSGITRIKAEAGERDPYTTDDLKGIFKHEVFTKNDWNYQQWLPTIALHTGMRLEEIAGLSNQDIKIEGDVWYFDIRELDDNGNFVRKLKNKSSIRKVPIHPKLIELGFLEYVKSNPDKLFPDLVSSMAFSRWWGQQREAFGISNKRKVFHSFRHTFKDLCRSVGMPEEVSDRLTGHTNKSIGRAYGDGYTIHAMYEWISKFTPYPR